jgi:hypothetical protein
MSAEEELYGVVQKVITDNDAMAEISPSWIATQVMCAIHFPRKLHELGYVGCHLEVRQIARQKLRHQHDPNARMASAIHDEQMELAFDTLQDRYPRKTRPGEEPLYVAREVMTHDDVRFNTERMRRGGRALLKHADALDEWDQSREAA